MNNNKRVTVIFYDVDTLELNHHVDEFPVEHEGRVIIPNSFKQGKSIVAVCEGENTILKTEFAV
ncbi:TIGR02922 family protein [Thalassotalea crassostreae]|uniref:TIGR02922 family protein n=1 Tax=Thalassotalea crassostreae TaxID=1763536 RepID=UPI000838ACA8|nr:TIGR02922 family protein [Thalassotalea crassostreae]